MSKQAAKSPVVRDDLIDALEAVLAHLWHDEFIDYRLSGGNAQPEGEEHFFLQLEVIRHWLDYVEEDCGRG
jgi:hypothetical protein